jgi:epoxyqueuosine reductase
VFSNYTSLPEKILFASSGLASFGKNSLLIHKKMGSYFVIGEAVTDIEVEFDSEIVPKAPEFSLCGPCRLCMDACPTGAIMEEGTVDINRCFQYLSQNLLPIPREYMERWGERLYGCTNCLEVCPYNSSLSPWAEKHNTGFVGPGMDLLKVLSLTEDEWIRTFSNNQIGRRERLAIVKNAIIALGNSGYRESCEALKPFLEHENLIIRICAAWAIGRINTDMNKTLIQKRLLVEKDPRVRVELELSLNRLQR